MSARVLVIGLDSVPPELFFGRYLAAMPFVRSLLPRSAWGPLRSCDPPITVPAWRVMCTGKSPQTLGLYGFRHRRPGDDYAKIRVADSRDFPADAPAIWEELGRRGKKVRLIGVPPSYPVFPVNGSLVSCFLTPKDAALFTHPPELSEKIRRWYGEWLFDVPFRTDRRDEMLPKMYEMSRQKFDLARRLLSRDPWDFAMLVDIGPDRMHHAFWKFCDPAHPKYEKGNRYEDVLRDYYAFLDGQIRSLMESAADERTVVYIVSDHGSKAMKGCFCVNEWLLEKGYLALKGYPDRATPLEKCEVDWARTKAWAWGGYYARVFVNVEGREPQGCVPAKDLPAFLRRLEKDLKNIRNPGGGRLPVTLFKPRRGWRGSPSDFLVYFEGLDVRSAGTLGHRGLFIGENDTGPDDAVHALNGICLRYVPRSKARGKRGTKTALRIESLFSRWLNDLGIRTV